MANQITCVKKITESFTNIFKFHKFSLKRFLTPWPLSICYCWQKVTYNTFKNQEINQRRRKEKEKLYKKVLSKSLAT